MTTGLDLKACVSTADFLHSLLGVALAVGLQPPPLRSSVALGAAWGSAMKYLLVIGLLFLGACTSSHILVGKQRPPISPSAVQVYLDPPSHYEKVAVLESNNRASFAFTQQQKTNKVVERLKLEAAALGANGILLQGVGDQYAGSIGTVNAWASGNSAYGLGISSATYLRVGSGIAIYVFPDSQVTSSPSSVEPLRSSYAQPAPAVDSAEESGTRPLQRYEPDPAKRCDACSHLKPA